MKIAIGTNIINGPWGGGNQFAKSLSEYLKTKEEKVCFNLKDNDIDIILLTEPRKSLKSSAFDHISIVKYKLRNPDTIIIHRINECDERKNTKYLNRYLVRVNEIFDYTIFISDWLRKIFNKYSFYDDNNSIVIRNGGDKNIFNNKLYNKWNKNEPLKIVTHHWGGNWMKGFDIYELLDGIVPSGIEGVKMKFTYIGNMPKDIVFTNTTIINPLSAGDLARELSNHHVYLTGSQNEPGGMHHIEGCLCGLPPLFRYSGALTEYCSEYGVGFDGVNNFKSALSEMIKEYDIYSEKVKKYKYTSELMCENYYEAFKRLLKNKSNNIKSKTKCRIYLFKENIIKILKKYDYCRKI